MSDEDDSLSDEQLDSLVANGNIVLQFEETERRVAVGIPFAVEFCEGDWWLCCPQGKFRLCLKSHVLFSRGDSADAMHWVSILESYRGYLTYSVARDNDEEIPIPAQVASHHADWLLGFLRQCALVQVSEDAGIPAMPPEARTVVATKLGAALVRTKQLLRRRSCRRYQGNCR